MKDNKENLQVVEPKQESKHNTTEVHDDGEVLAAALTGRGKGFFEQYAEYEGQALRAKYGE